jgi:cytochrome c553
MRAPIAIAALCLGAATASAQEQVATGPDAEAGRALAAPCVACHGEDGNATAPINPSLAGQNMRYLVRQMLLIRDGGRAAPLMAGQLDRMTDEEIEHMAAFYASQTPKVNQAPASAAGLGQSIYRGGILDKQVAACTGCHAPDGSGNAPAGFPALTGQPVDYVVAQLTAYREGLRTTDEEYGGMMRQTAARMTDGEIRAVADYVLGLH